MPSRRSLLSSALLVFLALADATVKGPVACSVTLMLCLAVGAELPILWVTPKENWATLLRLPSGQPPMAASRPGRG